jgi:hypothetical protein
MPHTAGTGDAADVRNLALRPARATPLAAAARHPADVV